MWSVRRQEAPKGLTHTFGVFTKLSHLSRVYENESFQEHSSQLWPVHQPCSFPITKPQDKTVLGQFSKSESVEATDVFRSHPLRNRHHEHFSSPKYERQKRQNMAPALWRGVTEAPWTHYPRAGKNCVKAKGWQGLASRHRWQGHR
jgi:hypothetical protein